MLRALHIVLENLISFARYRHKRLRESRWISPNANVFFFILLPTFGVLLMFALFFRSEKSSGLIPTHHGKHTREEILRVAEKFPRVTELDCSSFLRPGQEYTDRMVDIAQKSALNEGFNYNNCAGLRNQGFDIPTTEFEDSFPIAYSIIVYADLDRFTRLFRAIYRSSNVYCIHVDQKSNEQMKWKISNLTSCFDNVFLPPGQIKVWWGSEKVLESEMVCLRALWKHKVKWFTLINLTGEEFPLKTNLELVHILRLMNDVNDVWLDPCTFKGPGDWKADECQEFTVEGWQERWKKHLPAPYAIQPYKGQIHAVLTRAMVDFVLHSKVAQDFYNWVNKTFLADETFFATLNSNPHIHAPGGNPTPWLFKPSFARVKLWLGRDGYWPRRCNMYVRGICLLNHRDMLYLTKSKRLFANKFKSYYWPIGYSCLEEWYFQRVLKELLAGETDLDLRVYQLTRQRYLRGRGNAHRKFARIKTDALSDKHA